MKSLLAWLALVLIWAALYLPGLGNMELKGEEARRTLPALEMIGNGDWIVPHLNGTPYLRKPPMINWLIVAAMEATHSRSEWAVRLPSALLVLGMAAAIFATASRWMPLSSAWIAAMMALSGVGLWEKGRLAEIEAVYVGLTGIALACWFAAWVNRQTGWKLWLIPAIFLGLGLLTKGPFHLLFFYAIVIPVLVVTGEKRQLWSIPHLASLALALGIFAAWAIPYFHATAALHAESVWANQVQQRIGGGDGSLLDSVSNILQTLANGLPWILFAPLWWNRRILAGLDERQRTLVCTARWPVILGFTVLVLIPGMQPRYTLPFYPAAALLLAMVIPGLGLGPQKIWQWVNRVLLGIVGAGLILIPWIARSPETEWLELLPALLFFAVGGWAWRFLHGEPVAQRAVGSALVLAGAVGVYAALILPKVDPVKALRVAGAQIDQAQPQARPLTVVDPGYQPILFYVTRPCVFVHSALELPPGTEYVLMDKGNRKKAQKMLGGGTELATFGPKDKRQLVLVQFPR